MNLYGDGRDPNECELGCRSEVFLSVAVFHFVFNPGHCLFGLCSSWLETHPDLSFYDFFRTDLRNFLEHHLISMTLLHIFIRALDISACHVSTFGISVAQRLGEHRIVHIPEMGGMDLEKNDIFKDGVAPPAAAYTGEMSHVHHSGGRYSLHPGKVGLAQL